LGHGPEKGGAGLSPAIRLRLQGQSVYDGVLSRQYNLIILAMQFEGSAMSSRGLRVRGLILVRKLRRTALEAGK